MAALDRYVNTASTSGGTGITNATTGTDRAYASLSEAEAAEQTNLVSATDTLTIHCSGSTADTTIAVFLGWTCDTTYRCTIAGDFQADSYDTGAYRIEVDDNYGYMLELGNTHIYAEQLQLFNSHTGNQYPSVVLLSSTESSPTNSFDRCVLKTAANTSAVGMVVETWTQTGAHLTVRDSLLYEGNLGIVSSYPPASARIDIINCTLPDITATGIELKYIDTVNLYNNLVTGAGTNDYNVVGTTTLNTGNNISSDATSPETGGRNKTITYTDAANDDYTTSDSDVTDAGVGPSSQALVSTLSLNGNTRSGTTTDAGAFQVAAGGVTGSGTLVADAATISGVGVRNVIGTGSLQADDATISGTGEVAGAVTGSGSLQADDATISGTGKRIETGLGALQAGDASINGIGIRTVVGSGALQADDASISGVGSTPSDVHRAEQIMDALVTALSALAPVTVDQVERGRDAPFALSNNKAITLFMGPDEVADNSGWDVVHSNLTVYIDIHARSGSVQVDQIINDIAKTVTTTLWADPTLGLSFVIDTIEGVANEPEITGEGNKPTGEMRTDWMFKYSRSRIDPSA